MKLNQFEVRRACYSYKDVLHDVADLEACAVYFRELETRRLSIRERVKLRLELDKGIPPDKSNLPNITLEDSISQSASNSSTAKNDEISPHFLLGKFWGNGLNSHNFQKGKWKFPFPFNFP